MQTINTFKKECCAEEGFTLVELAVVMIIIGLLLGGVMKGQELIRSAEVSAAISQIKNIDTAVNAFRDSFDAMPGDLTAAQATARIPNCGAAPCAVAGDNNNRIDSTLLGFAGPSGVENRASMIQMVNVNLLLNNLGPDDDYDGDLGGELSIGYHTGAAALPASLGGGIAPVGHYVEILNDASAGGAVIDLTANQAARVDRKLDDGVPDTGTVQGGGCVTAAPLWDEANSAIGCRLVVQLSN